MDTAKYERLTINAANPLARFAHRSRHRRSLMEVGRRLPSGGAVVDFGAGPGRFLMALQSWRPDAVLYGVEPFTKPVSRDLRYAPDFSRFSTRSFDVVTAFEVCEHLDDDVLDTFITESARVLRDDGWLIVSVPILHGLAVPLKALNQLLLCGGKTEWSWRNLARAVVGLHVERAANRNKTHLGFDFRDLRRRLSRRFEIESEGTSPIPGLPWFVSSQMFFFCRPREAA